MSKLRPASSQDAGHVCYQRWSEF